MYRILVADDEGIMLEAFKSVISSTFGDSCITETAKTGRAVTEKAETFHPDIVFMDIHMPGINGIQAMREIRKFNTTALFYVVSAYDKFDYAKEAIDLGVERYLTKPISKAKIISAVEEAIEKVDKKRNQRSHMKKESTSWNRREILCQGWKTGSMPDFVSGLEGSGLCGNWSALTVKHSAR